MFHVLNSIFKSSNGAMMIWLKGTDSFKQISHQHAFL